MSHRSRAGIRWRQPIARIARARAQPRRRRHVQELPAPSLGRRALAPGRRAARRPGPGRRTGHRRDAPESGPGRLAELAANARRLGLQPARPDRSRQRPPAAASLGVASGSGAESGDAARTRRGDVHPESRQQRAGARRRDRRAALGICAAARRVARRRRRPPAQPRQPLDRPLRRQGLPEHQRGAHRRPRRAHRRGGLGSHRGGPCARLSLLQRTDRGERGHRGRDDRLPELQERRLFHLGPRPGHRRAGLAHVDHRAPRRARRRHVGRPPAGVPRRLRLLDPRAATTRRRT